MRRLTEYIVIILTILLLTSCGQEPLKFRNMIEADQYIRNNIANMEWSEFELLLDKETNVTQEDFMALKGILSKQQKTSHVEVENVLYRFNNKLNLMYMTEWVSKNQLFYLKDVHYITNDNLS